MARNSRLIAARVLHQVIVKGHSLDVALDAAVAGHADDDPRSAALAQEISYGVIRHFFCLRFVAGQLLSKPMKKKDQDVLMLILAGLYQLAFMRIPAHAAVSETVAATRGLKKPWARGLVNAVLRGYQRNSKQLQSHIVNRPEIISNHPAWLLRRFYRDWPASFKPLITANNLRAPMSLRVNLSRLSRDDYLGKLQATNIDAIADARIACAITLASPANVGQLPGFADGDVSVQDISAQQAALLLDIEPGMRVLDACAAPGGKTGHLLELVGGDLDLTALDISKPRLARVRENLQRLGHSAKLVAGDAANPQGWWDSKPYDRILIDAPCSGTGVIRRHPDIKLHRRPSDITQLAALQATILSSLWKLLAAGGKLLYCTCSVIKEENDAQLSRFIANTEDAQLVDIAPPWGRAASPGWQVITGTNGMDGFYYGCIQKKAL